MQKLTTFAVLLLSLFFSPKIFAVEIKIDEYPTEIGADEFLVKTTVLFSGTTNATNFLRVDLYKNDTNDYFGETWNGTNWYSGSDGVNYFPIEIKNGSGSAELKARIPNPLPSLYAGPGEYKLRVRRYTASGNAASGDTYLPADTQINLATPTPAPSPTPSQTPSSTPPPTNTSTPKPTPNPTPTPRITPKPTPTQSPKKLEQATSSGLVLAALSLVPQKEASSEPDLVENASQEKTGTYPYFFIGSGVCFLFITAPKLKGLFNSLAGTHFSG